jgi:hypothetical protein
MKKKARRLTLNRETLHSLQHLHYVVGGVEATGRTQCETRCASNCSNCGTESGSGDYSIFATCNVCSNECATGGACTVGC